MLSRYNMLLLIFIASFGLSTFLKPTIHIADEKEPINLEDMIPKEFGDWEIVEDQAFVTAPTQEIQATEDEIYQQVLMRTYRNTQGDRIMLAIAYGDDQSDSLKAHKPEVCYTFQGFQILSNVKDNLSLGDQNISARRLIAKNGVRQEPITYWITVGNKVVKSGLQRKFEQLKFGLLNKIPDGMLIRVSNISHDYKNSYKLQNIFLNDLVDSVELEVKHRIIGS